MQELPAFLVMHNPVQHYAWGSRTAIPELLGAGNPEDKPWAELWMGAHPKGPSYVTLGRKEVSLSDLIAEDPGRLLGPETARRFDNHLPFLFKVLAAAAPLSIQAHPNLDQARRGFAAENEAGIPLDAPHRNYRDPNHKPETICALSRFHALCGFRPMSDMTRLLRKAGLPEAVPALNRLCESQDRKQLKQTFRALMTLEQADRLKLVEHAVKAAASLKKEDRAWEWVEQLHSAYPGDVGVLAPLLLNLVVLEPGQAMFLPAGELHAYLDGVGIEIMANSDNVLRGGLTPKHVDVRELLGILTFSTRPVDILEPESVSAAEKAYPTRAGEFRLSVLTPSPDCPYISGDPRRVEIMICTDGAVRAEAGHGQSMEVSKGTSVLVPACAPGYRLEGRATLYKATVP